jgi:hypothetical protein
VSRESGAGISSNCPITNRSATFARFIGWLPGSFLPGRSDATPAPNIVVLCVHFTRYSKDLNELLRGCQRAKLGKSGRRVTN